jgi:hypothetical protein
MIARGKTDDRLQWLGFGLLLALAGTFLHDLVEFGRPSPQNGLPATIVFAAVFLSWWQWPNMRHVFEAVLLTFALAMLIGGALASVLPLPVWPFEPEQALSHCGVSLAGRERPGDLE